MANVGFHVKTVGPWVPMPKDHAALITARGGWVRRDSRLLRISHNQHGGESHSDITGGLFPASATEQGEKNGQVREDAQQWLTCQVHDVLEVVDGHICDAGQRRIADGVGRRERRVDGMEGALRKQKNEFALSELPIPAAL